MQQLREELFGFLKFIVLQNTEMSYFGGVGFVCVVVQRHRVCTEVYE